MSTPATVPTEKTAPRAPGTIRVAAVLNWLGGATALITVHAGVRAAFLDDTHFPRAPFWVRALVFLLFIAVSEYVRRGRRWAQVGAVGLSVVVLAAAALGAANGVHVLVWLLGTLVALTVIALLLAPASRAWFAAPPEPDQTP
jgi:hypothetical protein